MSNYFILMAAGSGVRMDSELPKQFIDVKGLPIVIHSYNKVKDLENLILVGIPTRGINLTKVLENE